MEQQGTRRRFSHILASSIGMCRSKPSAESPVCVTREPISTLLSPVRKPQLAELFSADSDTTRCDKFDSDKTCEAKDDKDKTTAFQADYYRKSSSSSSSSCVPKQHKPVVRNWISDPPSDSDIASSVLVELSLSQPPQFQESVCSNEPANDTTNKASSGNKCSKPRSRGRGQSEVTMKESGGGGGSVAVAKRSVDPYGDFKRSMVEMIVENEIFGREELEELLLSFLGLNSPDHHKIIVLVFADILQILFSNSSSFSKCSQA